MLFPEDMLFSTVGLVDFSWFPGPQHFCSCFHATSSINLSCFQLFPISYVSCFFWDTLYVMLLRVPQTTLIPVTTFPKLFGRSAPLLLLKLACLVALLVQTAANFYHYLIQPDRQVSIIYHWWFLVNTDCWLPGQHCWRQLAKSGRVSSGASSGRAWRFRSKQFWSWRLQYVNLYFVCRFQWKQLESWRLQKHRWLFHGAEYIQCTMLL